jgi:hypothetical protein
MLKISRIRPYEYNKSCVFFTTNPTKLSLHFSEFSTIFYAFYKIQPKVEHYLRSIFHRGPWKTFQTYTQASGSRKTPWKELAACNWVPGHGCRRRRPKFRCSGAGIGRGKGGRWLGAHHASVWGFGRGGGVPGGGVPRRRPVPIAGASAPVWWVARRWLGSVGELE